MTATSILLLATAAFVLWRVLSRLVRDSDPSEDALRAIGLLPEKLMYSERQFWAHQEKLVAKVDRAYALGDELAVVELKQRATHRVYRSDVIELSAQRLAIEGETGTRVADRAYVVTRLRGARSARVHTVELLGRDEVRALRDRRWKILRGVEVPRATRTLGLCAKCAYRGDCTHNRRPR